ncbi:MAG: AAA family ATPase [Gemmatimonadetes bacterium]|nr:AAA family ATPase [Gemmatimonadota bacterium]
MSSTLNSTLFIHAVRLKRDAISDPGAYPFSVPAVQALSRMPMRAPVTILVGENGSGKSTLLEAIAAAYGFNPEGGTLNFRFATRESHSPLHEYLVIERGVRRPRNGFFLRAESFFNVATEIDRLGAVHAYGGVSLHEQSHGESFLTLVTERFGANGLYILDEPEAALSPSRQLALLVRMHDLVQAGSQFILATHSPLLMAFPGAAILSWEDGEIREAEYEDTEHYQVSRRFLMDHKGVLRKLLDAGSAEA